MKQVFKPGFLSFCPSPRSGLKRSYVDVQVFLSLNWTEAWNFVFVVLLSETVIAQKSLTFSSYVLHVEVFHPTNGDADT